MPQTSSPQPDIFKKLPKVELHRHLEGSIRLSTMLDVSRQYGLDLPLDPAALSRLVQVQPDDPITADSFLSKFLSIRKLFCAPEVIQRIMFEAVEDAANDNIRYMELRFTPVALGRLKQFALSDVMDWACAAVSQASQKHGIKVTLIASTNRHEAVELAAQVASLAAERRHKGIVGIDLAGNEGNFAAHPFLPVFEEARRSGLNIALHAGEWSGPENVREAIEQFGAARIGHGVRTLEDAAVVQLARERGTTFEVCVTSNFQTGVCPTIAAHPYRRMLEQNLRATLNTDDPSLSQITLTDEYRTAIDHLKLTPTQLKESILTGANAAFLPDAEKAELVATLKSELDAIQLVGR